MNERVVFVLLLLCGIFPAAHAETEGFAHACGSSTCFWRRPIVDPPPGWVRDEEAGAHFKFNAFAKKGEDFVAAGAVLYANAIYRKNAAPTLAEQIAADKERILKSSPGSKITEAPSRQNADAKRLATFMFIPEKDDEGWETVAYDEEGDYYLRFVLSAQTRQAHDEALPAFTASCAVTARRPGSRDVDGESHEDSLRESLPLGACAITGCVIRRGAPSSASRCSSAAPYR